MTDQTYAAAVSDAAFLRNAQDARENGYDRLCAVCGVGTAPDDMDIHERGCPEYEEFQP